MNKPAMSNLGWMKLRNPDIAATKIRRDANLESFLSHKSLVIIPIIKSEPEAAMLSYPIESELKESVGFNKIKMKLKYTYLANLVFRICLAK